MLMSYGIYLVWLAFVEQNIQFAYASGDGLTEYEDSNLPDSMSSSAPLHNDGHHLGAGHRLAALLHDYGHRGQDSISSPRLSPPTQLPGLNMHELEHHVQAVTHPKELDSLGDRIHDLKSVVTETLDLSETTSMPTIEVLSDGITEHSLHSTMVGTGMASPVLTSGHAATMASETTLIPSSSMPTPMTMSHNSTTFNTTWSNSTMTTTTEESRPSHTHHHNENQDYTNEDDGSDEDSGEKTQEGGGVFLPAHPTLTTLLLLVIGLSAVL